MFRAISVAEISEATTTAQTVLMRENTAAEIPTVMTTRIEDPGVTTETVMKETATMTEVEIVVEKGRGAENVAETGLTREMKNAGIGSVKESYPANETGVKRYPIILLWYED